MEDELFIFGHNSIAVYKTFYKNQPLKEEISDIFDVKKLSQITMATIKKYGLNSESIKSLRIFCRIFII